MYEIDPDVSFNNGRPLTDELSDGIKPQNMKIEKELVVCIEAGFGEFGVAKRVTSHNTPLDFPSRITICI